MTILFIGNEPTSFTRAFTDDPAGYTTLVTGFGVVTYDNTRVRNAVYANGEGSYDRGFYADMLSPASEGWVHFEVNNGNGNTNLHDLIVFISKADAGAKQLRIATSNAGTNYMQFQYSSNGGSSWNNITVDTVSFGSNALRRFDIHYKFHATNGIFDVYLNETLLYTYSGALQSQDNVVDRILFTSDVERFYSQVIVTDSAETTLSARVHAIYPNGAGAVNEWNGDYTDVDEVVPSSADLITTDTVNNRFLFNFTDISSTFNKWDVAGVMVAYDCTLTADATPNDLQLGVYSASTEAYTASLGLTKDSSRQKGNYLFATNPISSSAWLLADVNNAQFGFKAVA